MSRVIQCADEVLSVFSITVYISTLKRLEKNRLMRFLSLHSLCKNSEDRSHAIVIQATDLEIRISGDSYVFELGGRTHWAYN